MKFRFGLALKLGMTVGELSQRMSSTEENHWIAYYRMEPWGEERADMRAASVVQMQHATHVKEGKQKPLKDFMILQEKSKGDDQQTLRANLEAYRERHKK